MYTKIQVVFDAAEPEKLAEFWGLALGYVAEPPPEGFDTGRTSPPRSGYRKRSSVR
jgi:Glyoxalase-like domain